LAAELRRTLVKAYAQIGAAARAFDTFERLAPGHAQEMTLELAALYQATNTVAAAAVFAQLVRRFPRDDAVCNWQIIVTHAANLGTDPALLFREAERLLRIFERTRFALPPEQLALCKRMAFELTVGIAEKTVDKSLSHQLEALGRLVFPARRN
jgi:hypothetical protein